MNDGRGETPDQTPLLGICTSVFGHRHALTAAKIRALAETGIEWAEIAALQPQHLNVFDDERVDEVAAALSESALCVWSVHAPFCGVAMDDADTRADGLRKLIQAGRVAERIGACRVVVHPGRDVPSVDRGRELQWTREAVADALEALPDGLALALETMSATSLGGRPEEMLALLDGFDPARVGVCMDVGHVNTGGAPTDFIQAVAGRIVSVHLHDNHSDRDAHDLPGEGNINWPAVIQALEDSGYEGPLMGECDSDRLSAAEVVGEFVQRMRDYASRAERRAGA